MIYALSLFCFLAEPIVGAALGAAGKPYYLAQGPYVSSDTLGNGLTPHGGYKETSKSKIIKSVVEFANSGGLVVGICNGFQILTEAGLLPGVLQQNKYLNFICKNINIYFKNIKKEVLKLHIAHNEGNYFCSNDELKLIKDNNQIAIKYCDKDGNDSDESNPNGAIENIAGIFNIKKNILGMMPHPERMIDKYLSGEDGSIFFRNLIENLK